MIKRSVQCVVILFSVLIITAVSVAGSQRGTRLLLQNMLPKEVLSIGHVEGHLLGHLVLQGVYSERLGFSAQQIDWQWQPQALLHWQWNWVDLRVTQCQIRLTSNRHDQSPAPTLSALNWPWYWPRLTVQNAQVDHVSIEWSDRRWLRLKQVQTSLDLSSGGIRGSSRLLGLQLDQASSWDVTGRVQGPWQHYQLAVGLQSVNDRTQAWSIQGRGDATQAWIDRIQGKWLPNILHTQWHFMWLPQLQIEAQVASTDLDLSQWLANWPSHLQADIRLKAVLDPVSWHVTHWQCQLHQLQGQVRHRPVKGQGEIEGTAQLWRVKQWQLQSGQARLTADGELGAQQTHFNWQMNIPDMADVWPEAAGSLVSQGQLQGVQHQWNWVVHAKANQWHLADYEAKQASLDFAYRTTQPELFQLQFTGQDWRWRDQRLTRLAISSQGQYAKQRIDWSIQSSIVRSQGRLMGGFDDNLGWQGVLQDWQVAPLTQAAWRLRAAVPLVLSQDRISVPQALCMQQGRQWFCGQGDWQKKAWQLHVSTSAVNLAMAPFIFPKDWHVMGQVQARIDADGRELQLDHSRVRFNAEGLRIEVPQANNTVRLDIGRVRLEGDSGLNSATANLALQGSLGQWHAQARSIDWQGSLTDGAHSIVDATLAGQLSDLRSVRPLLPTIMNSLTGRIDAKATYHGAMTGANHQARVDLRLTQAAVNLQDYNIRIAPLTLAVSGDPSAQLAVTGRLQSGAGFIHVSGLIDQLWNDPRVALELKGQNFLATNLSTYQVTASPDVRFTYQAQQMHLDGDLLIPKAALRFVDYQHKVVKLTSDVVYVDQDSSPLSFYSDLHLLLGNQVMFQYGGLKGRLLGQVALLEQPNRLTQGRGEIRLVDGVYQAFGQSFTIRKGLVQFNGGEVTNPTVDAEAVRHLTDVVPVDGNGNVMQNTQVVGIDNDLTVGVSLHGPLSTSQIRLFSQPAGLSQADILSYLLIGRPSSEATGGSAQLLMSAASMLSGRSGGSSPVTQLQQQLKSTLGLEVDVGATSQYSKETQSVNQNTSVILGKALSPRLFLNYSIGISQPVNVLRLTYRISPKWSAQSESSSLGNGGDLFYTINSY